MAIARYLWQEVKWLKSAWDLRKTIKALRHPKTGCRWDLRQSHESLRKYLFEECYEAACEMTADSEVSPERLKDELGDVLFQVLLHSQIASDSGSFQASDVLDHLSRKLRRRHPHIFDKKFIGQEPPSWAEIKEIEKHSKTESERQADKKKAKDIFYTQGLPPLRASQWIGECSQDFGFDWDTTEQVFLKVKEECLEVEQALKSQTIVEVQDELGDLMFSVVQLLRHLHLDPDETLVNANIKFLKRFKLMLSKVSSPSEFKELGLPEKEALWVLVKSERV